MALTLSRVLKAQRLVSARGKPKHVKHRTTKRKACKKITGRVVKAAKHQHHYTKKDYLIMNEVVRGGFICDVTHFRSCACGAVIIDKRNSKLIPFF
ncbi:MAG: hypothetical protein WA051_02465 [Minisyncoccia bacterium]